MPLHRQASLYATGGCDGTAVLRKIFEKIPEKLDRNGYSKILMVTELPNVLSSCDLVESMIDTHGSPGLGGSIKIGYCVQDVENVEEYSEVRVSERNEGACAKS